MNEELEKALYSISNNQVPKSWQKRAYPSLKPLASWVEDFIERVKFFKAAVNEKPKMYWISAFFFPQGFLTSVLQIHARKLKVPIDSLSFAYTFKQNLFKDCTDGAPTEGCLIYGLYSEACCVDLKSSIVKESAPDVIDTEVPVIHFKPIQQKGEQNGQFCEIPLYKTKLRAGTLSTTGHSTNFIISITCKTDQEEAYWIKRGAAFFCSL
jgi:dynein heavy chain